MSKSTKLALTWLATIEGALSQIKQHESDRQLVDIVDTTTLAVDNVIDSWPIDGNLDRHLMWGSERVCDFDQVLRDENVHESPALLAAVATFALTDLDSATRNLRKKELLQPLFGYLDQIDSLVSTEYEHCLEAERICNQLNNIMSRAM